MCPSACRPELLPIVAPTLRIEAMLLFDGPQTSTPVVMRPGVFPTRGSANMSVESPTPRTTTSGASSLFGADGRTKYLCW